MNDCLYFKQIEMGPMQNFVYLIGSTETRKVAVVDAAWEIDEILRVAAQDNMEITHALVTHTHPDHVGGRFAGVEIEGVAELLSKCKPRSWCTKRRRSFSRRYRLLISSRRKAATRLTSGVSRFNCCIPQAIRLDRSASWWTVGLFRETRFLSDPVGG